MNVVAVIAARGGSKSIPLKNIRPFCGKPLIAWSIESAKAATSVSRVIVSTDSEEIAAAARESGAEVPFLRPAELAGDSIGLEPVLKHTNEWLQTNESYTADALVLLPATTPTRQPRHIDEMLALFVRSGADSVVAVNETPANHTPYWTLVRNGSGGVTMFNGTSLKNMPVRRQDFPQKCYARNDIGYVLKPSNLYQDPSNLYGDKVELYVVEDALRYEVDINTPDEWADAEAKMQRLLRLATS